MEKYDKVVNKKGVEARVLKKEFNHLRGVWWVMLAPQWVTGNIGAGCGCSKNFDITPELEEEWQLAHY